MKNEIFDNMLSRYDLTTEQHKRNAIFEVNQQMILAGLYAGGFFESAAFYGGTCLRIFHGLQRFSEDMDFSLLTQDDKFDFTKYFPAIIDAFAAHSWAWHRCKCRGIPGDSSSSCKDCGWPDNNPDKGICGRYAMAFVSVLRWCM